MEDEIGVDLLKRSPRGVTLTAEGKLFLEETREILRRVDESVAKTQALARGDYGELHIGYSPSPTVELLPPAMIAFQKYAPQVRVVLHDLAGDELVTGLLEGTLELALMVQPTGPQVDGIEFEVLRRYPMCLAMSGTHPFAKLRSVPLEKVVDEPLVVLRKNDYSEYHRILERVFAPLGRKPRRFAVECDSGSSFITEAETGRGLAIVSTVFKLVAGKRLVYRKLAGTNEAQCVGIARSAKGDVTPAGEKFCAALRNVGS